MRWLLLSSTHSKENEHFYWKTTGKDDSRIRIWEDASSWSGKTDNKIEVDSDSEDWVET